MNPPDKKIERQPSTSNSSSDSQVFVITPTQIAKLGLTKKLKTVIDSQLTKKTKSDVKKMSPKSKLTLSNSNSKVASVVNDDTDKVADMKNTSKSDVKKLSPKSKLTLNNSNSKAASVVNDDTDKVADTKNTSKSDVQKMSPKSKLNLNNSNSKPASVANNDDSDKVAEKQSNILKEHLQRLLNKHENGSSNQSNNEQKLTDGGKQTPKQSNAATNDPELSKNAIKSKYYDLVGNSRLGKLNVDEKTTVYDQPITKVVNSNANSNSKELTSSTFGNVETDQDNRQHNSTTSPANTQCTFKSKNAPDITPVGTEENHKFAGGSIIIETGNIEENTQSSSNTIKLEIVGNELVNFSPTEIQNILRDKMPFYTSTIVNSERSPPKIKNNSDPLIDKGVCLSKSPLHDVMDVADEIQNATSNGISEATSQNPDTNEYGDCEIKIEETAVVKKSPVKYTDKGEKNSPRKLLGKTEETTKHAVSSPNKNSKKCTKDSKAHNLIKCKDFSTMKSIDVDDQHPTEKTQFKKLRVKSVSLLMNPTVKEPHTDALIIKNEPVEIVPDLKCDKVVDADPPTSTQSTAETLPIPTLKKRGRKKKTEEVAMAVIEPKKNDTYMESRRTGRRRKHVDYNVLSGNSSYEELPSKKRKFKGTSLLAPESDEVELDVSNQETDDKESSYRDKEVPICRADVEISVPGGDQTKSVDEQNQSVPLLESQRGWKRKADNTTEGTSKAVCVFCNTVFDESEWAFHKQNVHNNLVWKYGDPPLDLNDQVLVKRILTELRAKTPQPLRCDVCGALKKSIPGFLSHWRKCRDTDTNGNVNNVADKPVKKPENTALSKVLKSLFSSMSNPENADKDCDMFMGGFQSDVVDESPSVVLNAEDVVIGDNEVKCAICNEILPKGKWVIHKQKLHNNLAWRDGDTPLDLNNQALVMRILSELYKNKKPLRCEMCGDFKKSVLGFLSHRSQCQKTDNEIEAMKVCCSLCGKSMLPVSLQRHMALSHSSEVEIIITEPKKVRETAVQGKRKAAHKAIDFIQDIAKGISNEDGTSRFKKIIKDVNFRSVEATMNKFSEDILKKSYAECVYEDCNYRSSEHEDLFYHIENCNKRGEDGNFTCNFCLATFSKRFAVEDHINALHNKHEAAIIISEPPSDNEFDAAYTNEDSDDMEQQPKKKQTVVATVKGNRRILFLERKKKPSNALYTYAYWWTEKFCQENYSNVNVFSEITLTVADWVPVESMYVLNYLPKLKHSIETARIKTNTIINPICYDYEWKKFKLFESEINTEDGTCTVFCGGPVSAMAWAPMPHGDLNGDQFLAVSVLPVPDKKYYTIQDYKDSGLIQIWNFGPLRNKVVATYQPKLEFCIAHTNGAIWDIEWCPSGCYDSPSQQNGLRKLGLMAVACSHSLVYIYTVLYPGQASGMIFDVQPTFVLQINSFTDQNVGENFFHSTRISWTKNAGHQYISVGYSNGMVAVYDLKTQSPLLRFEDDVVTLKPIQAFKAHTDAITALVIHYLNDGKRWLLTGSLDRDSKLWDLDNLSEPVNSCRKFIITDAIWLTHWLCSVYGYDHGCISGAVPTTVNPARDFFGSISSFMPSNSRVTSLSASEWGNLFIQANDCGEIICGFPDQLLYGYDCDKRKSIRKARCVTSYTGMVAKGIPCAERINIEAGQKLEALKKPSKCLKKKLHVSNNSTSTDLRTYQQVDERYGLVFCDLNMDYKLKDPTCELDKLLQSTNYHTLAKPDIYPMQAINKITCNPNKKSFLYYASGYQVGLVRVSNIRFLCPENK